MKTFLVPFFAALLAAFLAYVVVPDIMPGLSAATANSLPIPALVFMVVVLIVSAFQQKILSLYVLAGLIWATALLLSFRSGGDVPSLASGWAALSGMVMVTSLSCAVIAMGLLWMFGKIQGNSKDFLPDPV